MNLPEGCTTEELPTGETVICHPPCEEFPQGRQVLVPGEGLLRARLNAAQGDACAAHADLRQRQLDTLHKAQQALADVPPEKRPI